MRRNSKSLQFIVRGKQKTDSLLSQSNGFFLKKDAKKRISEILNATKIRRDRRILRSKLM